MTGGMVVSSFLIEIQGTVTLNAEMAEDPMASRCSDRVTGDPERLYRDTGDPRCCNAVAQRHLATTMEKKAVGRRLASTTTPMTELPGRFD